MKFDPQVAMLLADELLSIHDEMKPRWEEVPAAAAQLRLAAEKFRDPKVKAALDRLRNEVAVVNDGSVHGETFAGDILLVCEALS